VSDGTSCESFQSTASSFSSSGIRFPGQET
jgi:hypothetical protein